MSATVMGWQFTITRDPDAAYKRLARRTRAKRPGSGAFAVAFTALWLATIGVWNWMETPPAKTQKPTNTEAAA